MKWTGLNELRETFLEFFVSKGHTRLPSAPLVPQDEASLLLINSGMAPLKKYFTRQKFLPNGSFRATSCQKCIRTPDIENVGKTARHGTYFEMLGNFSFGDYFKEDATRWAWEFITEKLELPVDKLYVSVYQDDDEAYDIWTKRRGVAPDHMVRLGKEDNFWEIGSGPCGPCSEIYFDRGPEKGCGRPDCHVGCDCDRYVEFWNLVFTQFNSDGEGHYTPLEHKNIDTGMGLERLACIMQGVDNLFEVDTVQNIMKKICEIAGVTYKQDEKKDVSIRVVTDHIRSTVFMIGDGVVPQNEGRGYVLRRLLRRAARHGRLLGVREPFLYKVADTVIHENESAYPELVQRRDYIVKTIRVEEERFARTIDAGLDQVNSILEKLAAEGKTVFSGEDAFRLYDTFGFPIDLTRELCEERGITVDEEGYKALMEKQRSTAREATARNVGDVAWVEDVLKGVKGGEDFVGYESLTAESEILGIVYEGERVEAIGEGDAAQIVLTRTPFYAEMGGQVGDSGTITCGEPTVTDLLPAAGVTETELLTLAAALEGRSEHPLARAVLAYAEEKQLELPSVTDFTALPGNGLAATLEGKEIFGGNAAFIGAKVAIPAALQMQAAALAAQGKTPLFFGGADRLLGVIAVADTIKEDSPQAIRELRNMGIRVVMLTGENQRTAEAISRQAGVDEVIAGVLPEGKEAVIRQLQKYGKVAMVGDGINDAPALTRADTGIAIGAGTDIAIESADIVLMNSSLSAVSSAIALSRATIRNIKENLFWAFFYNCLMIPVAIGFFKPLGISINPMIASLAMVFSSLTVIFNALRLKNK